MRGAKDQSRRIATHRWTAIFIYPIAGVNLGPLEHLVATAKPAQHRVWAPFEDGRREWYELPNGTALIAEVAVTTLDSGLLRQPARFLRWRFVDPPIRARS